MRPASRALLLLICTLAGYCLSVEAFMRVMIPRLSAIEGRHATDERSALSLKPRTPSGAISELLVGNSLLQAGVNREQLQRLMQPGYHVVLLPIENTTYWDWYFGLRRLFAAGAGPAVVVVCLNADQVLSNATDGDRFAYSMMRLADLPRVVRAVGLNSTAASDYLFANLSAWLGLRAAARNAVLQKWLPGAAQLVKVLSLRPGPATAAPDYDADAIVARLGALRQQARAAGAQFMFLVPPAPRLVPVWVTVQERAARDGLRILVPLQAPDVTAADFADGMHLNAPGASLFTARLSSALQITLDSERDGVR